MNLKLSVDGRKRWTGAAVVLAIALRTGFGLAGMNHVLANSPQGAAFTQSKTVPANPTFEVASIRLGKPTGRSIVESIMNPYRDGRFYASNITAKTLIAIAYRLQERQILGGPNWLSFARFDIQAKSDAAVNEQLSALSPGQAKLVKERMLQALLTDRFKLTLHRETKEAPVYALIIARHGPRLSEADDGRSGRGKTGETAGGGVPDVEYKSLGKAQQISARGGTMLIFVHILSVELGRTVVDRTGLTGKYDFTLKWGRDGFTGPRLTDMGSSTAASPGSSVLPSVLGSDTSGPSIFTAIQHQLGLKLKLDRGPADVYVIDHIERPTSN